MTQVHKLSISLPAELVARIDALRQESGETRSAILRRAAERLLLERRRVGRIAEYVAGYRRMPETADEVRFAEGAARDSLALDSWE